jgi:hypothetical protein
MAQLPPESVRRLRARMGGFALAASHDPLNYTAAARAAFRDRFVDQVDPERQLPEPERSRRAEAARRLHMTGLALRSAVARKRSSTADASTTPAVQREGSSSAPAPE